MNGPIRYTINKYNPGELIQFEFTTPKGFYGIHQFEVVEVENDETELKHTIEMNVTGIGILIWTIIIRWLHDALMEDAFSAHVGINTNMTTLDAPLVVGENTNNDLKQLTQNKRHSRLRTGRKTGIYSNHCASLGKMK